MITSCVAPSAFRTSFLQLPPRLRVAAYQRCLARPISQYAALPPQVNEHASSLSIVLEPCLYVLNGLHATGLPWWAAIPASALVVRGIVNYYCISKPVHKHALIHASLGPLITAKTSADMKQQTRHLMSRTDPYSTLPQVAFVTAVWCRIKATFRMGGAFHAPFFWWGSANFLILIAMTEAIRLKSGARAGLGAVLTAPVDWIYRLFNPAEAARARELDAQKLAERLEKAWENLQEKQPGVGADGQTIEALLKHEPAAPTETGYVVDISNPRFDPSLQVEGLDWFRDLTLPDATGTIPIALGSTIAIMTVLRARSRRNTIGPPRRTFLGLGLGSYFQLAFSVFFTYIAFHLPVAILLYIWPSTVIGFLQQRWLNVSIPVRQQIKPCKRPVSLKVNRAAPGTRRPSLMG